MNEFPSLILAHMFQLDEDLHVTKDVILLSLSSEFTDISLSVLIVDMFSATLPVPSFVSRIYIMT